MATNNFKYAQLQPFALAGGGAIAGATTLFLPSMTDIDGNALSMAGTFGTKGFGTLDPGNGTLEEQISFTGLTNNANGTVTLTGVSSTMFVFPYTESSGLAKTHAGATPFVISNTAAFYNKVVSKDDDATVTGKITFPNDDVSNAGIATDTDTAVATAFVTLGQLSRQAISGASNASTSVKGIVQLPTQVQVDAKTTTGSTGALLALTPDKQRSTLLSDYVVDTGAADAYAITPVPAIAAYTTGQIFSFKSTHTNTTTSTLNVNALGVKTIKKLNGATNLAAGDIVSGQIITVEYDGTNFQMLNPVGVAPITVQSSTDIQTFTATGAGTWTKPTTTTPKKVFVQVWGAGGSGSRGNTFSNTGGGGGGYAEKWFDASALGVTEAISIATGGASPANNTAGNAGGNSTFGTSGTLVTAYGGAGGALDSSNPVLGGAGGGNVGTGSPGAPVSGISSSTTDPGGALLGGAGGGAKHTPGEIGFNGGAAFYGGGGGGGSGGTTNGTGGTSVQGGAGGTGVSTGAGNAGTQPGGGGGGSSGAGVSGAGGNGKVVVTTFF